MCRNLPEDSKAENIDVWIEVFVSDVNNVKQLYVSSAENLVFH